MMKEVFDFCEEKMGKSIANLEHEFGTIRAGRANTGVLDRISVDYYGAATQINQLAAVSVAEARILVIQPYDVSILREIEKAILASDIGINPQNDGRVLRLTFPPLTEERRKELVKTIHKYNEESKIAIRSIRRDAIEKLKKLKKDSVITEDDLKHAEKKVQDQTDKYCADSDAVTAAKEKEVMEI